MSSLEGSAGPCSCWSTPKPGGNHGAVQPPMPPHSKVMLHPQRMNKKWSDWNIYGWVVRVFHFSFWFLALLKALPMQIPGTPQLFLNSYPGSNGQEGTRRHQGTTQQSSSHHFQERRRLRCSCSQREGETKDCGTGKFILLHLSFNSKGIWGEKKHTRTKEEGKKADQEIKCSGISDHMKNAQCCLTTLSFSLAVI